MTDKPTPSSAAEFALSVLVAAGHVSQELVDRALALPGAPQPARSGEPVAKLVQAAQAFVLDPTSLQKKLYLEAQAWGPLAGTSQPVEREPLTDEQWQRIADLTDSILTRATKDEIECVIGIKGGQHE